MHTTEVNVLQLEVVQSASRSTAVGVLSNDAKLLPERVTVADLASTLYGTTAVIAGPDERARRGGQPRSWYASFNLCGQVGCKLQVSF